MSVENPFFEETVTPASAEPTVDAFEAALAAVETSDVIVEEVIADEQVGSPEALDAIDAEVSIEEDLEDENDPNAEFRRALRTAAGDWFVVHSYAG